MKNKIKDQMFIGIVMDNKDPKQLGRCKINVLTVYDTIATEDLPWATPFKDLNGNEFNVPEKNKVVQVIFNKGNIYKPEFIYAEHYNINLEKKIKSLSDAGYTSMKALVFDHKTQIYSNDDEGLIMDYKINNINITESDINLNLKDNYGHVNIGTANAAQQAILGNNLLNWFDTFVNEFLSNTALLGNMGQIVVASPTLIEVLNKYTIMKDPDFLSKHINLVDNESVTKLDREVDSQIGDAWSSTITNNIVQNEPVNFLSTEGISTDTPNGQLTPYVDTNGNTVNPVDGNSAVPALTPSNNPIVDKIIAAMKARNYIILNNTNQVNIVGIRRQYQGMQYSNSFMDDLYVIYMTSGNTTWTSVKFKITTMPGFYSAKVTNGKLQVDKTGISPNVKQSSIMLSRGTAPNNGLGILMEAQYVNIYQIGEHCGAPAMKTRGVQKFYRDNSPGNIITYTGQGEGYAGMLIHRGYPGGSAVSNWSEGCQVFSKQSDLEQFFNLCNTHANLYGNILLLESDLG